jgi:hypothetical protein
MPLTIEYEPNDICVLRISVILMRAEFGVNQEEVVRKIDAGAKLHPLAMAENFAGWERDADWNDGLVNAEY